MSKKLTVVYNAFIKVKEHVKNLINRIQIKEYDGAFELDGDVVGVNLQKMRLGRTAQPRNVRTQISPCAIRVPVSVWDESWCIIEVQKRNWKTNDTDKKEVKTIDLR